MSAGELILYRSQDGSARIQLRAVDGSVWLSQAQMAELFDTSKQNISLHLKNIFADNELDESAVVKDCLTTGRTITLPARATVPPSSRAASCATAGNGASGVRSATTAPLGSTIAGAGGSATGSGRSHHITASVSPAPASAPMM